MDTNYVLKDMTALQYSAIQLQVPDSGVDWLDKMIRKANRREYAGQVVAGLSVKWNLESYNAVKTMVNVALTVADAIIREEAKDA